MHMNTRLKIAIALLAGVAFNANATVYSATATGTIKSIRNFGGDTSTLAGLLGAYPQVGQRFVETVTVTVPNKLVEDPLLQGDGSMAFYNSQYAKVSVSYTINGVTKAFSMLDGFAFIKYERSASWGDYYEINANLYDSNYSWFSVGMDVVARDDKHLWDSFDPSKNYVLNSSQVSGGELTLNVRDTDFNYSGGITGTIDTISISAVPEPGTYGMMLGGLALLGVVARRNKKTA